MKKYTTRDGKILKVTAEPETDEVSALLNNIIPRLSYDEILDGELEKRIKEKNIGIDSIRLSSNDDVKTLIFSLAMFNAVSKAPGL